MEARLSKLFANSFMWEGGLWLTNWLLHQSAYYLINRSLPHINSLSLSSADQWVECESDPTESSHSWEICYAASDTKSITKKLWRACRNARVLLMSHSMKELMDKQSLRSSPWTRSLKMGRIWMDEEQEEWYLRKKVLWVNWEQGTCSPVCVCVCVCGRGE